MIVTTMYEGDVDIITNVVLMVFFNTLNKQLSMSFTDGSGCRLSNGDNKVTLANVEEFYRTIHVMEMTLNCEARLLEDYHNIDIECCVFPVSRDKVLFAHVDKKYVVNKKR